MIRGSNDYEDMKASLKYSENVEMMDGTVTTIVLPPKMFDKDPKEATIDELCKQVENNYLMMMKQSRQAPKQLEPVC